MREIKFRAWDKSNCMMVIDPLAWMNVRTEIINYDDGQFTQNNPKVRYELMQYTGLLDKNGKEIYEGDILSSPHFKTAAGKQLSLNHIVEWSDDFHGWFLLNSGSMDKKDGSIQMFVAKTEKEVIGNIHENPELVNA